MRAVDGFACTAALVSAVVACSVSLKSANAASFNCARATSEMERLVCGNAALGGRDEILARLYAAALNGGRRGSVEAEQRTWFRAAQACCSVACLAGAYDRRIAKLQRSQGEAAAGTDFFGEGTEGNHGTLNVVGPIHGFASVSLSSTYVGAGGIEAGDVYAAATDAFLDFRSGPAVATENGCRLTFRPLDADRWEVGQTGGCDLPGGTIYAGIYHRLPPPPKPAVQSR